MYELFFRQIQRIIFIVTEKIIYQETEEGRQEKPDAMVSSLEKAMLAESDLKLNVSTGQSPNMILVHKGGQIAYVNNKCEDVIGYTKKELLSNQFNLMSLIAPEAIELVTSNLNLQQNGLEIEPYENVLLNKAGEKIDAIITSKLIDYEGERAILWIVTDMRDRHKPEKALTEGEEKYQTLISNISSGYCLNKITFGKNEMPIDSHFLKLNQAFEQITGLKATDLVGKTTKEVFPGTEYFWVDRIGQVALSGNPLHFKRGLKFFGQCFEVIAYSPGRGQVAAVFTDIADQKGIEASGEGVHVFANRSASELTGYSVAELLKRRYRDLVHPNEFKRVSRRCKRREKDIPAISYYETILIKKDGVKLPIEVTDSKTLWQGQSALLIVFRDISLRKRFEAALGESHNELENRVNERTNELMEAAEKLEENQRELLRHKQDLEKVNDELVQTNVALSVLTRNIDRKRDEVEKKIAQTIGSKIIPLLEEIRYDKIPEKTHAKLDVLSAYLNDLTSEATRGRDVIISLSPSELRVAMMIKNGFTSREISRLLNISHHTVKTHRKSIRKKLNIINTEINLASYLKLKLGNESACG
jgi:PAS domain S-box-containing protein